MATRGLIPGGGLVAEEGDGASVLVPGIGIVQEAEAVGGVNVPVIWHHLNKNIGR